jgi:hypothetical protein
VPPAPNPPEPQTPPCECEISSYLCSLQKQRRDTSNSCELAICRPSFNPIDGDIARAACRSESFSAPFENPAFPHLDGAGILRLIQHFRC